MKFYYQYELQIENDLQEEKSHVSSFKNKNIRDFHEIVERNFLTDFAMRVYLQKQSFKMTFAL